jgi:hypothetical protein
MTEFTTAHDALLAAIVIGIWLPFALKLRRWLLKKAAHVAHRWRNR